VKSNSEINTLTSTASGLQIRGNSNIGGLRFVKPMSMSTEFQHVLTMGFDYKDVMEEIAFPDDPKAVGMLTPMSLGLWSAEYKATWRKPEATTRIGSGVYFGLRNVFNSAEEFDRKRFGGDPNFIYWKLSLQRDTQLPADFTLVNKVRLQHTASPLVSNEQISIGGDASVRGYFESQNLGDRGVIGNIEVYTPKLFATNKTLSDFKLYSFLEAAAVEVMQPLKDQNRNFTLASAGLGLELGVWSDLKTELNVGYPLRDACNTTCGKSVGDVEKGETRTTFKLTYKY
jgi:hemolysin activation/secretion protein